MSVVTCAPKPSLRYPTVPVWVRPREFPLTSASTEAPVEPKGYAATRPVVAPETEPTDMLAWISACVRATFQMRTSAMPPLNREVPANRFLPMKFDVEGVEMPNDVDVPDATSWPSM